jgi:hypothetical protein
MLELGWGGPPSGLPSAIRTVGVTVIANNTAAAHNKKYFLTVSSSELELLSE